MCLMFWCGCGCGVRGILYYDYIIILFEVIIVLFLIL